MTTGAKIIEEKEVLLVKRIWNFIMGGHKPPFLTRIILLASLVSFFYYFLWNTFRYFALLFIDTIDNPEQIKANMQSLGEKHGIDEALSSFSQFFLAMILIQVIILVSMIFVYRRQVWGYYLFVVGQICALVAPVAFLSWDYFMDEIDFLDKAIPIAMIILFGISMMRLKRVKKNAERERIMRQL